MVKETENETEKSNIPWLSEFSKKSIKKSAEVEIKPKLTIDGIGIEYAKNVVILSDLYKVEIPKEKAIRSNKIWMIDLEYENVNHQFIAEAGSFRFQLGVLMEKLNYSEPKELIDLYVKLWKEIATIDTPTFKGKAEVYKLALV